MESKRRFFRKAATGSSSSSSSRTQHSLDSPSQSPIPSLSPSLENTSLAGIMGASGRNPYLGSRGGSPGPSLAGLAGRPNFPGNSVSLDEAEQKGKRAPRFMTAPRRARSAERYDGKRVTCNSSPADAFVYAQSRDELLAQYYRSATQQPPIRTESPVVSETVRRNQAIMAHAAVLAAAGMQSAPPPTYSAAVNEQLTGPPSYHQAVAAMTMATAARAQKEGKLNQARYAALAKAHRGAQSFDAEYAKSVYGKMRPAVSVPAFTDDVICSCSKCRVLDQPKEHGDYNDNAVYMESQAFLMQEIMTDGMAFCSIV